MRGQAAFLRVGLMIVGGTIAVLAVMLFLSGDRWRKGQVFESYFAESVQGLEVGGPVKFRGVTLGRVSRIGLVSAEYSLVNAEEMDLNKYRQVFVRYTIDPARVGRVPDTESAIRTGLRARIASQGITGLSYIELDFVDPAQFPVRQVPWIPAAEVIPSMPSTFTQVQDAAQHFLAELNKVDIPKLVDQITGLVVDIRAELGTGDVHMAIAQIVKLLETVQANVDRANVPALVDAARSFVGTMNTTVEQANVAGLVADARVAVTSARNLMDGPELRAMMTNIALAAERLAQATAKLQPVLNSASTTMRRVGDGTADLQQALGPLLRDVQAAAANLREVTDGLRQYPAGALLGGPPPRLPPAPSERAR
jgi:ABC-type transporter Mla subunit MlaD